MLTYVQTSERDVKISVIVVIISSSDDNLLTQ